LTRAAPPPSLRLRPVERDDAALLHGWANDPVTRRMSFSTEAIPLEAHLAWLDARLRDPDCLFYVVHVVCGAGDAEGEPVGQVRFDLEPGGDAQISISLAPERRGQGMAAAAIRLASRAAFATGRVGRIRAEIRAENAASLRAFAKAGYGSPERVTRDGAEALRMTAEPADLAADEPESR
jgi:RimJ/RimL family protein N-acetyltransferase